MNIAIVGGGISGATLAALLSKDGHLIDVYEKRGKLGGNCSDTSVKLEGAEPVMRSDYGIHIFHTNKKYIWDWVNKFTILHPHILKAKALTFGGIFSLPINLNTLSSVFNYYRPDEPFRENEPIVGGNLKSRFLQKIKHKHQYPLFELFIKYYSEKQWGRPVEEIPASIADRIPTRNNYDDRYFTDKYQGVPTLGYTDMVNNMLNSKGISVYKDHDVSLEELRNLSLHYDKVIFCGALDNLFDNQFGELEYRSLRWEDNVFNQSTKQGCLMLNNCTKEDKHTRTIEWKFLSEKFDKSNKTLLTKEYPEDYVKGKNEPLYPVGNYTNITKHKKYLKCLADISDNIVPLGRLAQYRYFDMDSVIEEAFKIYNEIKTH